MGGDWFRKLSPEWKAAISAALVVVVSALAEWIARTGWSVSIFAWLFQQPYLWWSVLFGVLTGAAEVIARYRDEPFAATFSPPGVIYLMLNGAISGAAYAILARYGANIFPGVKDDLLRSIVAGFGAMVIMRSKLFNFKTEGGEDYAIGPDAVLSTFLTSVDRKIDRGRSLRRQEIVFAKTAEVLDAVNAPSFLGTSLASYQNLGAAEKRDLDSAIKEIVADTNLDPRLKLVAISFGLLNICGDKNFLAVMDQLVKYQQRPTR